MALGYEKINTSAARAKRRAADEIPREKITITPKKTRLRDPVYGDGVTLEDFVSDCDNVRCEFNCGYIVTLRGGAVRCGIAAREKKDTE